MRTRPILPILILVFALGSLSGYVLRDRASGDRADGVGSRLSSALQTTAAAQPTAAPMLPGSELTSQEERDISIFRDVSPSVVYISQIALRRDFRSLNVFAIPRGTGSGFVWDDRGHVVTNYHVVAGGDRFFVALAGEQWDATLIGAAPDKDLAVLRIQAPRELLQPVVVGSSASLRVGQRVLAIGNPFGLDQTLTVGILSALGRELDSPGGLPIRDVIQTDAAINPGNSGGPLLDSAGRLIGVNTAIYSPSGASAGIGFAVPVDTVRRLVPQLIEHGRPLRAGLGMELVPDRWARWYRVEGVIVGEVVRGGPAARAGIVGLQRTRRGEIVLGDVIVAVDGEPVRSIEDLVLAFEDLGIGARTRLTLTRDGRERTVEVELIQVD